MKYTSSNQESRDFYVQPGDYDVRVIDAVETVSKNSGAEMIKLTLEVEGHGRDLGGLGGVVTGTATAGELVAQAKGIDDLGRGRGQGDDAHRLHCPPAPPSCPSTAS